MENLDTLLAPYPPFDELGRDELLIALADAREVSFERGDVVLIEDGRPAPGLWVILEGSMELVHDGEVIHVLEPGECFGHPSMLTGMAPAFTVRAHGASRCLLLSPDGSKRVLGTVAGARFIAESMRKRLTGAGHTVHGLHEVGTTPVSAIMRPAQFCLPEDPIREAARRLGEGQSTALLVQLSDGALGIVSDSDIRAGLAEERATLDSPIAAIAHTRVPTVPPSQLAIEATIDMLSASTEHVAVVDRGQVLGLLSAGDLLGLDTHSPIALRHTILGAPDVDALVRAADHLSQLFVLLARAGVPSRDLGRVLSLQHDAVVSRLIDFSIRGSAPAPASWAWLDLGSAARRELTLASDQDNALAYANPEPDRAEEVDAYFARLGADVNDGLARCGVGVDNNGVLAGKRLWRMSKQDWLRTFDECLEQPDESHLVRASVAFDFRPAAGGLTVVPELTQRIRAARTHPQFMRLMARTATGYPVALGFRGQLATGRNGDRRGKLDLKRGAIVPIVNLVRFHALANGVTISPTLDRIEAVASVGGLERAAADGLAEAFEVISRVRFELHVEQIAAGAPPGNLIDPGELAPIGRAELREALRVVRQAQRRLSAWAPPGV